MFLILENTTFKAIAGKIDDFFTPLILDIEYILTIAASWSEFHIKNILFFKRNKASFVHKLLSLFFYVWNVINMNMLSKKI